MRAKLLIVLAVVGILAGLASAYFYGVRQPAPAACVYPRPEPYAKGVYANGIIESYQSNGANINIFPEVSGTVTQVLVAEGAAVAKGTPLLADRRFGPEGCCRAAKGPGRGRPGFAPGTQGAAEKRSPRSLKGAGGSCRRQPQDLSGPIEQAAKSPLSWTLNR